MAQTVVINIVIAVTNQSRSDVIASTYNLKIVFNEISDRCPDDFHEFYHVLLINWTINLYLYDNIYLYEKNIHHCNAILLILWEYVIIIYNLI